jgi:LacI family transcriptional regulator
MAKQAVTIYDIAYEAKVSQSTVSRVLSGSTRVAADKRAAVLAAVDRLKYRPNVVAQGLARGRSSAVGVLTLSQASPYYGQILLGVEQGLAGSGLHALVASVAGEAASGRALDMLLQCRVDALVVVGEPIHDDRLPRLARDLPLVAVGPSMPDLQSCVHSDSAAGGRAACEHLIALRHRRIGHITGPARHRHAQDRRLGWQQALEAAGLPADPTLVVEGRFDEASGAEAATALLERHGDLTAIFAGNDQMAYGARLVLHRRGLRVPEDVSLVGFDDQPYSAYTTPPLTTVRQPTLAMGKAAALVVLAALRGGERAELHLPPPLPTELVVRESTARPRTR